MYLKDSIVSPYYCTKVLDYYFLILLFPLSYKIKVSSNKERNGSLLLQARLGLPTPINIQPLGCLPFTDSICCQ